MQSSVNETVVMHKGAVIAELPKGYSNYAFVLDEDYFCIAVGVDKPALGWHKYLNRWKNILTGEDYA